MKDISDSILNAGDHAVQQYLEISGLRGKEDTVPEIFLSCAMAIRLPTLLAVTVRVEQDYKQLAHDLNLATTAETDNQLERLRADIAVYENGRPSAIIEVKKFAESGKVSALRDDLMKGDCVSLRQHINVHGAFLVCETSKQTMTRRQNILQTELDKPIQFSGPYESAARGWTWCFGCVRG